MVCRTCGNKGDHQTSKCPYKDLAQLKLLLTTRALQIHQPMCFWCNQGLICLTHYACSGAVRPTAGADTRRNDENSVRVNNLSEDTIEPDLMELFCPFGNVSCVYVAMEQKTGTSRGFGSVNFVRREEGERAIAKLNGRYGYDNLILSVEWAAPRATQSF